jgi:hypothetical protein
VNEPINIILLMIVLAALCGFLALSWSPDALETVGRKLRARAQAIRASRLAWIEAYNLSHTEQANADSERAELREVFREARK